MRQAVGAAAAIAERRTARKAVGGQGVGAAADAATDALLRRMSAMEGRLVGATDALLWRTVADGGGVEPVVAARLWGAAGRGRVCGTARRRGRGSLSLRSGPSWELAQFLCAAAVVPEGESGQRPGVDRLVSRGTDAERAEGASIRSAARAGWARARGEG